MTSADSAVAEGGEPEEPEQGDDTTELVDPTSNGLLKSFGRQVKVCRERTGMSQVDLGRHLGYSQSQIASIEIGRRIMQPKAIDKADEVLGAGGILRAMKEHVARAAFPRFFRDPIRYEAKAAELRAYDLCVVNRLLQTEEYARALYAMRRPLLTETAIDERVTSCLDRQRLFTRDPAPIASFVMDESVLRRPVGNHEVLRGQLEHLLLVGRMRNVELQVLPLDREDNAGLEGPFTLMETDKQTTIAYVEVQGTSRLHTEHRSVRDLEIKYRIISAQALSPRESLHFMESLLA